ncbi:hypothetical protein [Methylobacterium haplocladii]|uniref:Uncharacterized protein n=1 Tax=Methylobacterium haplocladii TaxID=1176176 RepID=A0A512IVR5_9HYPH|nr:hypothetical protein [Methylobacterium haplocladii]GEP01785.1 hypothetical protein MHA02_41720 [Methylobacterium haplocladii]GJD86283.1 hypothetical protein HPGCJGGD_4188 [Methylobacterium haplocladii]GLS60456.1 hypothetical protein GCM10007887_31350 [Methylobacterium haplocladii]
MSERVTSVSLKRGLFALRYVRSGAAGAVPTVSVQAATGSEAVIVVISAPGARSGVLLAPGGSLVVRAEQPGALRVTVRPQDGGSADAELQLEPLHAGLPSLVGDAIGTGRLGARVDNAPTQPERAPARLEVMGHVSRRGDVSVGAGQWIAGPDAPAPIEGLALRALDRPGLAIEYQVLIGGSDAAWTRWTTEGYVGTRGKFKSLHGIRLRLTGADASAFEVEAEALFLGSATAFRKGREIELISHAAADPLVGLKLALISGHGLPPSVEYQNATAADDQSGARAGRVRVFRASGMRS